MPIKAGFTEKGTSKRDSTGTRDLNTVVSSFQGKKASSVSLALP